MLKIGEAASALGVSVDTLRRWEREGRLRTVRNAANHRLVSEEQVRRLGGRVPSRVGTGVSTRNRFEGIVRSVELSGVVGLVEIESGPHVVVAVITRDAIEELGLEPGVEVAAMVKATSVMVERRCPSSPE
ncbi:MAG TPA: helix-turn-helix transcriptional regulator [Gaiellales bacterium]|nr:helix-turn-helix transcriptional regulator [Gaiellales bacterium]